MDRDGCVRIIKNGSNVIHRISFNEGETHANCLVLFPYDKYSNSYEQKFGVINLPWWDTVDSSWYD